jgi:uncharacterized protein
MVDLTVVQRLEALVKIQVIDSKLDKIRSVRGGLPEEVRDLEDELEGLKTRVARLENEINLLKSDINERRNHTIEQSNLIKKYEGQLMEVKNSREFEAIQKEIEIAKLEIQTDDMKIRKINDQIRDREIRYEEVHANFLERQNDLKEKNDELEVLIDETRKEEDALLSQSNAAQALTESRILKSYTKIRQNMRNGLAVVTMDRGACGGCFAVIPPQRQYEIRQKKRLIICENCGRILVDDTFFEPYREATVEEPIVG